MTNLNYQNTIQPLIDDLDENVITYLGRKDRTEIYFANPVTCTTDKVIAEHPDGDNNKIEGLFYVIDIAIGKIEEHLIMDSLEDLYDFILIDDTCTAWCDADCDGIKHTMTL